MSMDKIFMNNFRGIFREEADFSVRVFHELCSFFIHRMMWPQTATVSSCLNRESGIDRRPDFRSDGGTPPRCNRSGARHAAVCGLDS
jgi:hypothetical protein